MNKFGNTIGKLPIVKRKEVFFKRNGNLCGLDAYYTTHWYFRTTNLAHWGRWTSWSWQLIPVVCFIRQVDNFLGIPIRYFFILWPSPPYQKQLTFNMNSGPRLTPSSLTEHPSCAPVVFRRVTNFLIFSLRMSLSLQVSLT